MYVCIYIYIYIYTSTHNTVETVLFEISNSVKPYPFALLAGASKLKPVVRPISLLRLSLIRFVDSNFPGNSLWA